MPLVQAVAPFWLCPAGRAGLMWRGCGCWSSTGDLHILGGLSRTSRSLGVGDNVASEWLWLVVAPVGPYGLHARSVACIFGVCCRDNVSCALVALIMLIA